MKEEHVISDDVLDAVRIALSKCDNWIAFNRGFYFIDKEDVYFFNNQNEAIEFARNNISDRDHFQVMHISSLEDLFRQVPYAKVSNSLLPSSLTNDYLQSTIFSTIKKPLLIFNLRYMGQLKKLWKIITMILLASKNCCR